MYIIFGSPLLDLRQADGSPVPAVAVLQQLPPEERERAEAQFRAELGAEIAKCVRDSFTTMALINPALRAFVDAGVFLRAVDGPPPVEPQAADRVQLAAVPTATCWKCRAPATGYQLRMTCAAHGGAPGPSKASPIVQPH